MRIGMLGGSFNPVHNAHLRVAASAQEACLLDKVMFIPAADPPHKPLAGGVSFESRSQMVGMAIADRTDFELSTIEAERDGKSYSIDTILTFRQRYVRDDLFFIIGGDSFLDIGSWCRFAEIFSTCNVIVAERPGRSIINPLDSIPETARGAFTLNNETGHLIHLSGNITFFITGTPMELSSTVIRQRAASGADISDYVPPDVAAYISQQRIYHTCR